MTVDLAAQQRLGQAMKLARKAAGLNQAEMGAKQPSTYSHYESGRVLPPLEVVEGYVDKTHDQELLGLYWEAKGEEPPDGSELQSTPVSVEMLLRVRREQCLLIEHWELDVSAHASREFWIPEVRLGGSLRSMGFGHVEWVNENYTFGARAWWKDVDENGSTYRRMQIPYGELPSGRRYSFTRYAQFRGVCEYAAFVGHSRDRRLSRSLTVGIDDDKLEAFELDCTVDELAGAASDSKVSPEQYIPRPRGMYDYQAELRLGPLEPGRVRGLAWRQRYVTRLL